MKIGGWLITSVLAGTVVRALGSDSRRKLSERDSSSSSGRESPFQKVLCMPMNVARSKEFELIEVAVRLSASSQEDH